MDRLAFNIVGEPSVKVAGDRAEIRFELTAEGTLDGGVPIKPALRMNG